MWTVVRSLPLNHNPRRYRRAVPRIEHMIDHTGDMAFGQASGPPATHKQVDELLGLLTEVGFESFREARYPMDFTQRQANGKFTREEADDFIEQLQERTEMEGESLAPVQKATKPSPANKALQKFPASELAAELQRRGWIVAEP